jgi:Cu-Zn family superoxide dismutase
MRAFRGFLLLAIVFGLLVASGSAIQAQDESDDSFSVALSTVAPILDAEGNQLGLVAVGTDEVDQGLGLMVIIQGLAEGEHGIHLHETGNCDPAGEKTFEKAGGHFNPGGMTHPHHAGDLGNLPMDAVGNGVYFAGLGTATFDDGEWSLADADGTALVIHETVDDLVTDPSGNSGARIACAVISAPAA